MRSSKGQSKFAAVFAVLVLMLAAGGCDKKAAKAKKETSNKVGDQVRFFETPAWGQGGSLVVRCASDDNPDAIFIRQRTAAETDRLFYGLDVDVPERQETIYCFDINKEALETVTVDEYMAGGSREVWDIEQTNRVHSEFGWDRYGKRLKWQIHEVESKGNRVMHVARAPFRDAVLVMSTWEKVDMGLFSTPKQVAEPGTCFHDMIAFKKGDYPKNLGESVQLPRLENRGYFYGMLDPESRYAIYTDEMHTFLCIVTHDKDQIPAGFGANIIPNP